MSIKHKSPTTPLHAAVQQYIDSDRARMHTPGHKGRLHGPLAGAAPYDLTEIPGLDSVYGPDGPILECERRYSAIYGSAGTFLSAGGSTLCVQAMLATVAPYGGKVLLDRGAHASAVRAMALLGLEPVWLLPERGGGRVPGVISPAQVSELLGRESGVAAVFITSPNYYGQISNIAGLAEVCHAHGTALLIDNAHGAHLAFFEQPGHPIRIGADMCCDSLHKTLPVLTGGALLHVADRRYLPHVRRSMALFGSTSPSYLIMLSIDMLLPYLEGEAAADLARTATAVERLRALAAQKGFELPCGSCDPTRLTLGYAGCGYTRERFCELMAEQGVEPELVDDANCVLLLSPNTPERDIARLEALIAATRPSPPTGGDMPKYRLPVAQLPLRTALLSPAELVPLGKAHGRVSAQVVSFCPPGVALLTPGEKIDNDTLTMLKKHGVAELNVVK